MKKDIGSRSFVEMYLVTKEDKSLFDKCVNHMSQKAGGKHEEDYSSTVLSQDPTLNTDSSDDKNDESTQSCAGSRPGPESRGILKSRSRNIPFSRLFCIPKYPGPEVYPVPGFGIL